MDKYYELKNKTSGFDKPNIHIKRDDSSEPTFSEVRVSYRGLCVETTNGWDCAHSPDKLAIQNVGKDPLQLVEIAGIYKDKIVWSLPMWVTVCSTAVAYLMVLANSIFSFFFSIPTWTRKLAAGSLAIAAISALGAMVLSSVISSSVSTIVSKVTMDTIEVHSGKMILSFGWTIFALVTASFIGVSAVVVAEWGVSRVTTAVEEQAEKGLNAATGGRYGMEDARDVKSKLEALKTGQLKPFMLQTLRK